MIKGARLEFKIQGGTLSNVKQKEEDITDRKIYNRLHIKHLISLQEYKEYVSRGNELLDTYSHKMKVIELKNIIYFIKKRFLRYHHPSSNIQFKTVYQSNIINRNRLLEMINHFMPFKKLELIEGLIKKGSSDTTILQHIKREHAFQNNYHAKVYRINKICNYMIKYLPKNRKPSILDIGIGSGRKTKAIREILDCDIFGADLDQWGPYKFNKNAYSFPVESIQKKPYHINYPDQTFDCITLILVAHHADDIIELITECKRMLRDDGFICIIDHDVWSDELHMILDLQHRIYGVINNEKTKYYASYYSFYEWDILFDRCGMTPIFGNRIHEDPPYRIRYDSQICAFYRKDKTD